MRYQEIIATPSHPVKQTAFNAITKRMRENSQYLMMVHANQIEAGLVHQTPAMEESERKLREAKD